MGLDTKYRPIHFNDVLGQDSTIKILRQFVSKGAGFYQSYLFSGPFGSGKTTLGRILARALLCENPSEGDPCDVCDSCLSIKSTGGSDNFVEVDAATNSGKADIKKITEEIEYSTFSGKRRVYLFDEAHQLSRDALDAMLKRMEEPVSSTAEDKKLVCIFCTTEPEKMSKTILSRCAPSFVIETLSPEVIAERLQYICEREEIAFDSKVLPLIAEITGCHIRDALKAVEGVSMLGPVDADSVSRYLHLDLNVLYLSLLDGLGSSLESVSEALSKLMRQVSPATCYDQLSKLCLLAFKASMGAVKVPRYLDSKKVISLGDRHGAKLVEIASYLSSRPARPTASMLECDLLRLHSGGSFSFSPSRDYLPSIEPVKTANQPAISTSVEETSEEVEVTLQDDPSPRDQKEKKQGTIERGCSSGLTDNGVHVDQRAVKRKKVSNGNGLSRQSQYELQPSEFCRLLALRLSELSEESSGSSGRINMGRT